MKNFRQQHRPKKSNLIIGKDAVVRALQQGDSVDRIYADNKLQQAAAELKKIASSSGVPVNFVPTAKLTGFNVTGHDGIIAVRGKVQYQQLEDVINFVIDSGESPLFLILDGITDIRNIGAISRTAFAMGVHAIIIPDKGIGALNEDAVLTSAGALEKIAICRVPSLVKAIDELHAHGIKVYASEMKADISISDIDLKIPVAVILGSEEKGIYPAILKSADLKFRIPMKGDFESLNVSVAAGMILYEANMQRSTT